jgi:glyoxylase-like metal-dependent hydrolase (beta-lactamase superfamily II)
MATTEGLTREWAVGNVHIVKVVEYEFSAPFDKLFVEAPAGLPTKHPWLAPHFVTADGLARTSIHGLVIDAGTRRILVDTCIGPHAGMASVPLDPSGFLDALSAAGYGLDDIDTVVCTHLHFDHVGWNTRLMDGEWRVTFPRARYLFGRIEWDHWQTASSHIVDIGATVRPVVDAGQADLVETDHVVCEEVRLEPTPGHTPGHVSVIVESGGERAVITGDLVHHPVQFAEPDLGNAADCDRHQATATRRRFREERRADGALVIGTHFPGPTAGRIVADGDTWEFHGHPA